VHSCSCTDNVVAAGTNGCLCFWDRRTQTVLKRLDETHMDSVTVLRFHPRQPGICFSASDDGLVAVFDFSRGINEDEAFVVRLSWQSLKILGMSLTSS
jgi:WD repeat-containing protein 89